jgi:hypothetical protein
MASLLFPSKSQPDIEYKENSSNIDVEKLEVFNKEHEVSKLTIKDIHNSMWQMYYFLNTQKQKFDSISELKTFGDHILDQVC